MGDNARDLAQRRRAQELQAVKGFNPNRVKALVNEIIAQMRAASPPITALEMIGTGDGIFITVAMTLLEVATPGPARETVRQQVVELLDRMRRDIETGPHGSSEVN